MKSKNEGKRHDAPSAYRSRRDRRLRFVILPAMIVAVAIVGTLSFRATLNVDKLRAASVLEATFALANEKATRLDRYIIDQDNAAMAIVDVGAISDLATTWLPTANRTTPSVRALLVCDADLNVLAFTSRSNAFVAEDESFRRLLQRRIAWEMKLTDLPPDELRHLHRELDGQSYLVSYWRRQWEDRRYYVFAWYDIGRLVREAFPMISAADQDNAEPISTRVNVLDEQGRVIFGPTLRRDEFTVGVLFPTTLYAWRLVVAPTASSELAAQVESRRRLEMTLMSLSCVVIVLGVATILIARERDARVAAMKDEFVANVSHELKTPLALVRMFAEMLESGRVASEDKRREYLRIILRESDRLSTLIENVLDFARLERGETTYERKVGSLERVVRETTDAFRYRAEQKGALLSLTIEPQTREAEIDERAIGLALMNLLDNALKYGGAKIHVDLSTRKNELLLMVEDDGPGVDADDRERIFTRFARGDAARAGLVRGTGIGLAIVLHVARGHGGRAWVEANEPSGARFCFTIA